MTGIAAGIGALTGVALGWWGAVVVSATAVVLLMLRPRDRVATMACGIAVAAAALGAWRAGGPTAPTAASLVPRALEHAIVVSAPVEMGQWQQFVAEVAADGEGDGNGAWHRICVTGSVFPVVRIGDVLRLYGSIQPARDAANAHRAAMRARGCGSSVFAESLRVLETNSSPARTLAELRFRIGETLRRAAPGDAGVLLSGLVTGDDAGFSPARQAAFIRTGTTHLTAVSGSNLALVAGILTAIGAATVGRHRVLWQFGTIGGLWAYALVSGAAAPATRAAIVATAAILAFRVGRRPDFPTLILLAAGAMALIDPGQTEALGFRLSVAAALALAVVLPPLIARSRGVGFAGILAASVVAQIATLPFLLPVFGTVSVSSIPANIVAVPLVAVVMPLAALAGLAGLFWLPLAEMVAAPAIFAVDALIAVVDLLGTPQAYVSVGVPPVGAAVVVAGTGAALLVAFAGGAALFTERGMPARRGAADHGTGASPALPAAAPLVFAGEDPFDALGADPDNPEEQPAGEENRHEVADVRELAQAIARQVGRHLDVPHPRRYPDTDDESEEAEHQHLAPLAHDGDVVATEVVEFGHP